jgi:hypothetical protein
MPNYDFSNAEPQRDFDVLPKGTLAFAILTIQADKQTGEIETTSKAGGRYLNAKLTICEGPFAKRVLFTNINTENENAIARDIGRSQIRSILEVGRNANAQNMAGYRIAEYGELSGAKVAIEVTIEPAKNGYPEKNGVTFITPNPDSATSKKFAKLLAMAQSGYQREAAAPVSASATNQAAPWASGSGAATNAPPPAQQNNTNKPAWL